MLEENGSLEFVLSKQWLEFLLGGNRAFNFMLILGISSKCDLKTPSESLNFHVMSCVCVCPCVWESNREQVARASSSLCLNPASSFLHQLITTSHSVSSSSLYPCYFCLILIFSLIKIIHVYLNPAFSLCSARPCLSLSRLPLFSLSLSPYPWSQRSLVPVRAGWLAECCCPGGGQRERCRNLI